MSKKVIYKVEWSKDIFTEKTLKLLSEHMKKENKDRHIIVKSYLWDSSLLYETAKLTDVLFLDDIFE